MKNKQYIKLPGISNQKIRQKYYSSASISHPAKANIPMMIWILKKFCRDGEIILDPMAGIFTTGIEGMRLFPNSLFIGVELEDKFVKMARANIKKVEKIGKKDMFMKIGKAVCVQGDARDLSKIMKEKVNKIISSPPYAERYAYKDPEKEQKNDPYASKRNRIHKPYSQNPNNIGNLNYGTADKIISSPPFQEADIKRSGSQKSRANYNYGSKLKHTSKNPNNIANLAERKYGSVDKIVSSPPFGQADKIITSPPYASAGAKADENPENYIRREKERLKLYPMRPKTFVGRYSGNRNNIGNLKYGQVDKIVTSPPYSEKHEPFISKSYLRIRQQTGRNTNRPSQKYVPYSQNQDNIGNLKHGEVDKVISSPPYEEGIGHGRGKNEELTRSKKIYLKGRDSYSKSKTNIGSLTGKTYLGEMLRVYKECYKVLKPAGLMILITKDFIRNKKRVKLGEDTIKLCQVAGFVFREIYYRKIEHPSFWRILYQQKHPEVEKIDSEDILIFEKTPGTETE